MEKEIENLRILVDTVANKVANQVKKDKLDGLKGLLWNVPTDILAEFAKAES